VPWRLGCQLLEYFFFLPTLQAICIHWLTLVDTHMPVVTSVTDDSRICAVMASVWLQHVISWSGHPASLFPGATGRSGVFFSSHPNIALLWLCTVVNHGICNFLKTLNGKALHIGLHEAGDSDVRACVLATERVLPSCGTVGVARINVMPLHSSRSERATVSRQSQLIWRYEEVLNVPVGQQFSLGCRDNHHESCNYLFGSPLWVCPPTRFY
jgi:hypothetical protein